MQFLDTIDQKPPFSWLLYQRVGGYFSQLLFPNFTIKDATGIDAEGGLDILMFKEHRTMRLILKSSHRRISLSSCRSDIVGSS